MNLYRYVVNNPLTQTDPSGYFCDDLCSPEHQSKGVKAIGISLMPANKQVRPGVGDEVADAAKWLPWLDPTKPIIVPSPQEGAVKAAQEAINKMRGKLAKLEGVSIWIKISGQCCEKEPCCIVWSRLNWTNASNPWYKCEAHGRDRMIGFDSNDAAGLTSAIKGCISDAEKAFKCPGGF